MSVLVLCLINVLLGFCGLLPVVCAWVWLLLSGFDCGGLVGLICVCWGCVYGG